jgi:hypothetical protein
VVIGKWRQEEWRDFRPIATDPEVMRHIGTGAVWTDEQIEAFVARQIATAGSHRFCLWKLVEKESGIT